MVSDRGPARTLVRREIFVWASMVVFNLVTHFAMLGVRAMSHDEGIHAYSSYRLWQSYDYRHDPPYHGPLLYHLDALVFALAGDSDATARAVPALLGVGLIVALFFARRLLGRPGAIAAAVLVSLSPILLFYGRYLCADIHVALFCLVWALGAFRYLESGGEKGLWAVTAGMALAFSIKEVSFIFGVTIGSFFLAFGLWGRWRRRTRATERALDLALWMGTLALPFAAPLLVLAAGRDPGAFAAGDLTSRLAPILAAVALALATALLRFRGWRSERSGRAEAGPSMRGWSVQFASFWTFQVALFTTLFTNFPRGLFSGVLGSLGYWLSQHEVARGSQPAYYYLLLALLYEALSLALCVGGAWLLLRRVRALPPGSPLLESRLAFPCFCLWWAAASWFGYTWAGERMPWLLVHIALPMTLVGGWAAANLVRALVRRRPIRAAAVIALGGVLPIFATSAISAMSAMSGGPGMSVSGGTSSRTLSVVALAAFAAGWLAFAWRERRRVVRAAAWRLVVAGGLAALALFSLRTSLRASFVNYDLATELLVYAHGTPDIKRSLAEIEELTERLGSAFANEPGGALEVTFDDEVTWPMQWYLRHLPQSRFSPDPRQLSAASPVVLIGKKHFAEAEVILGRSHVRRDYRLIWWPYEGYRGLTLASLGRLLADPGELRWLYDVVAYRRYGGISLEEWTHRSEFRLYIDRELAAKAWPLGLEALELQASRAGGAAQGARSRALWCEAEAVYTGPFEGLPFSEPASVAALPGGGVAVADVGNHRIVVLGADGLLVRVLGSGCELERGAAGGCLDPDGPEGGRPLGEGQFWQPWGIAVSIRGDLAVADTWNGRVQLFDRDGRFMWSWGRSAFGPAAGASGPESERLFGPRAVAFDPTGERIVVADTGNKRLVVLSLAGELVLEVASPGSELGGFAEPIGLAFRASDVALFVADTWNQRLLEADEALAQWRVAAGSVWRRKAGTTTPYLGTGAVEGVLLTDPDRDRLVNVRAGEDEATVPIFGRAGDLILADPVGVAVAGDGRVWVSSRRDGALWRLPPVSSCEAWNGPDP